MDRRDFLAGSAGLGAAGLASLFDVRARFSAELAEIGSLPTGSDYSLAEGLTYFNHGSIGTVPTIVQKAHAEYLRVCETNPWLYMWGGAWDEAREETRKRAAAFLGCDAEEIAINRNTTDGFNVLAAGLRLKRGDEVLFSNLNHSGASVCWHHQAGVRGFVVRRFDIPLEDVPALTEDAIVELYSEAIGDRTRVLVMPHMDNTVGVRTPVAAITKMAREKGVEFVFADGAQTVGMLPVDVRALGVDAYCMSPHKWLQSPKGLGLMYVSKKLQRKVRPQTVTWGQVRWMGSARVFEDYGTRDLPAVLALGDAIEFHAKAGIQKTATARHELWKQVKARVDADDQVVWRSPRDWNVGGSLYAIQVKKKSSAKLAQRLWQKHRCVVRAFPGAQLDTLRLSLNVANTPEQIATFFRALRGS